MESLREGNGSEIQSLLNRDGRVALRDVTSPASLLVNQNFGISYCNFKELNVSIVANGFLSIENCYSIEVLNVTLNGSAGLLIQKSGIKTLKINGVEQNINNYSVVVKSDTQIQEFIGEGNGIGNVSFDNTKIGSIDLRNSSSGLHINIKSTVVERQILIKGVQYNVNISDKSEVKGDIFAEASNHLSITVLNSVIRSLVKIIAGSYTYFQSTNSKLFKASFQNQPNLNFIIQDSVIEKYAMFDGCGFSSFSILGSPKTKSMVNVIKLKNSHFSQSCRIDNATINALSLIGYANTGLFKIQNTSIKDRLYIEHSQLGTTQFQNVDLDFNLRFKLENSTITDSKFYTVNWVKDYRLVELKNASYESDRDKIQYLLSLKESYRQLKAISQAALNKFDALNFQRHEQRIQKEILWLKKEYWDFFLLKSNEIFNNYGLSYVRPFKWLIGFHFAWFAILLLIGNTFDYNFFFLSDAVSWKATLGAISDFLYTLFPLHSSEYLHKSNGLPLIIDLLMRLTSGYFIYYFLSATRKFHLN